MCSFVVHVWWCTGDRNYCMCSNSLYPWQLVVLNPLSWYLGLTCIKPDIISDFLFWWMLVLTWNRVSFILYVVKGSHLQRNIRKYFHIVLVFWNVRSSRYSKDFLVVLWTPSGGFALYGGYMCSLYCLCYSVVFYCCWAVSYFIFINGFF